MSYNNELYGGFGYKDYYDMVEKSAKKLSDNGKQKIYSASTHRKICEAQQKKILNTLIGKKTTDTQFTKEDIKLAKTDVTKIKDTSKQSTDIDAVKL